MGASLSNGSGRTRPPRALAGSAAGAAGRRGAKFRFLLAATGVRGGRTTGTGSLIIESPMKGVSVAAEVACIEMLSLSSMTHSGKWRQRPILGLREPMAAHANDSGTAQSARPDRKRTVHPRGKVRRHGLFGRSSPSR